MILRCWLLTLPLLLALHVNATHLRSAEIRVERICGNRTVKITLVVYLDSKSSTLFGTDGRITFGDGTEVIIPRTVGTPRPDLGTDISTASFTVTHTYSQDGTYKINYRERDRSSGVMNMTNPGDTAYSSSTTITISDEFGCNHYPILSISPVDRTCPGVKFFHNPGAIDADGDSLSYALTIPARDANNPVFGYLSPADPFFYTNFATGNEAANGPPTFVVDPETGLIMWDAPGKVGEYNIAFQILEWRKNQTTGLYALLSTTVRDMQILVEDCANQRPDMTIPSNICVVAGTVITGKVLGIDPENNPVKIEAVSEVLNFPADKFPATLDPAVATFGPSDPPAQLNFEWKTNCVHVRDQSYQVVFKITDQPRFGTQLVTFKTWTIKVIAPKPEWNGSGLDLVNRNAVLEWNDYACQNAQAIQIWRRVGSYAYTPGVCDAGLPKFLGYKLIAEVDPSETTYTDTNDGRGLAPGAQYCYRIVAAFTLPAGGKSYTSQEICVGPIESDAPVITHVTVKETDLRNGRVEIKWRSPFDINKIQFPKPYYYEVYRGEGFSGEENLTKVSGQISDSTFSDQDLNTTEQIYNYRIVVYAKPQGAEVVVPVDTSATASSVWLQAVAGNNQIELTWDAEVPWSNVIPNLPWHRIYRGEDDDNPGHFQLIDSVDVTLNGFTYIDTGLDDETIYSYRILTQGTYGNPKIPLQRNHSQIASLYPQNDLLPCKPVAHASLPDCEGFLQAETCLQSKFNASVSWSPVLEVGCRRDIVSYKLFAANSPEEEFKLIAPEVKDTLFLEENLPAFARCYRIIAVDASGHESEWSDPVCTDNCANFQLPNVFTPNDDGCNDIYSAFSASPDAAPGGANDCEGTGHTACPRFVEYVEFSVFNRWGRPVYSYNSSNNKSISIDWDGRDNNGNLLEPAVYYYVADVTFQVLDPEKRNKKYKGWIHLLR